VHGPWDSARARVRTGENALPRDPSLECNEKTRCAPGDPANSPEGAHPREIT
jgi:hypothetical protein